MSSEWQPIESAPKDGTELILFELVSDFCSGEKKPYVYSGKFDPDRNPKYYETGWKCLEYDAFNRNPTHWMPMLEPPK